MAELIQELCTQAGLQYLGVGLRYNGPSPAGAFVRVIDPKGHPQTLSFPQVHALATACTNASPSAPNDTNDTYLRSATLLQIADDLDRRATLACKCTLLRDDIHTGCCTLCHGTGRVPWIELRKIANFLRDVELPF